jgi:hypothetical protein
LRRYKVRKEGSEGQVEFIRKHWKIAFFSAFVAILCEEIWKWGKNEGWNFLRDTSHIDWASVWTYFTNSGNQATVAEILCSVIAIIVYAVRTLNRDDESPFLEDRSKPSKPSSFADLVLSSTMLGYFGVFAISLAVNNLDGLIQDLQTLRLSKAMFFAFVAVRLAMNVVNAIHPPLRRNLPTVSA